jgi:hypothetical protein
MCQLIANNHRNVALIAKQGTRYVHLVTLTAHGLETGKLTEEQLTGVWGSVRAYSPEQALARFQHLAATLGATEGARRLLTAAAAALH